MLMHNCSAQRGPCVVDAQLLCTERNFTALYRGDTPASLGVCLSASFLALFFAPAILVQATCTHVLSGDVVALLHIKGTQSGLVAVRIAPFFTPSEGLSFVRRSPQPVYILES